MKRARACAHQPARLARGFWGDLAAGNAAYNRSAAGIRRACHQARAYRAILIHKPRRLRAIVQSIDSALRVISDPELERSRSSRAVI
ncbi:MAG: hypothetical protein IPK97_16955 [Ahniella sp.]|nr:hypothetical protein [Ahniella sp.]